MTNPKAIARAKRDAAFDEALRVYARERALARDKYLAGCPKRSKDPRFDPAAAPVALVRKDVNARYEQENEQAGAKYRAAKARAHAEYQAAIAALDMEWEPGLEDI